MEEQQALGTYRDDDKMVVPLLEEDVEIQKRRVETGRVRVTKLVNEREEVIDEPLLREDVDVRRVAVNRVVDDLIPVRREGDTIIISVVEEQVVVHKQLVLKEEVHITRRQTETHEPQRVVVRSEEARVERVDGTLERP